MTGTKLCSGYAVLRLAEIVCRERTEADNENL